MKVIAFLAILAVAFAAVTLDNTAVKRDSSKNIEWKDIVSAHAEDLAALIKKVKGDMTEDFKTFWNVTTKDNEASREILFGKAGYVELQAIADQLKVDHIDVAWFNYFLNFNVFTVEKNGDDDFKTIPAGNFVASFKNGTAQALSLNPVKYSDELRKLAVVVEDGDITALTFAGMVGYFFAMKKNGFSISYNNVVASIPEILNVDDFARTFATNVRALTETNNTYADLQKAFNNKMASPVFYTFAGASTQEATIVSINKGDLVTRSLDKKVWYMGQSAEDIKDTEKYLDLHDSGLVHNVTNSIDKVGSKNMSFAALKQAAVTWPGRNIDTVAVVTADANSDSFDAILNECHNIFKDFGKTRISHCVEKADGFNLGVTLVSLLIGGTIIFLWIRGANNAKRFQNEYSSLN